MDAHRGRECRLRRRIPVHLERLAGGEPGEAPQRVEILLPVVVVTAFEEGERVAVLEPAQAGIVTGAAGEDAHHSGRKIAHVHAGAGLVVGVRAPGEEAPALVERVFGDVTDHQRAAVLEPAQEQVGAVARMLVFRIVGSTGTSAAARSSAPPAAPRLVPALVDRDPVCSIAGERVGRHLVEGHELTGTELDDAEPSFVRLFARWVGRRRIASRFRGPGIAIREDDPGHESRVLRERESWLLLGGSARTHRSARRLTAGEAPLVLAAGSARDDLSRRELGAPAVGEPPTVGREHGAADVLPGHGVGERSGPGCHGRRRRRLVVRCRPGGKRRRQRQQRETDQGTHSSRSARTASTTVGRIGGQAISSWERGL